MYSLIFLNTVDFLWRSSDNKSHQNTNILTFPDDFSDTAVILP